MEPLFFYKKTHKLCTGFHDNNSENRGLRTATKKQKLRYLSMKTIVHVGDEQILSLPGKEGGNPPS